MYSSHGEWTVISSPGSFSLSRTVGPCVCGARASQLIKSNTGWRAKCTCLEELDDVWMVELFHDGHFTVNLLQIAGVQLCFVNYLDGHLRTKRQRTYWRGGVL